MAAAGVLYGLFVKKTHLGVPCIFHLVTGFKCPGCGVTRMAVALLQLDVAKAFEANAAIVLLSPVFFVLAVTCTYTYIKTGVWKMGCLQNAAAWFCIVVLIIYGIGRNVKQ